VNTFDEVFEKTVALEGRYSNDPKDLGGKTAWGITERVARANGYTGRMEDMTREWAKAIYRKQYWDLLCLDAVAGLSKQVAFEVFDTSVNCGQGLAGRFLQRSLNVLNREETDFQDVRIDGLVGPVTVAALKAFLDKRGLEGEKVLLVLLNCLQGTRYVEMSETRKKNETFTYGWIKERVKI